jgi:cyclohexa-1,5-dienecarbonyl-CoA hydratase
MATIEIEERGDCTVLRLNRPEALNSISNSMLAELEAQIEALEHAACRALVLTGTGRAFCAGTDLKESHGVPEERMRRVHALVLRMRHYPKPIVAALNGLALGGGLELALACTFRVARADARLGLPEVKLALLPAYAGTQLLPRLVGESAALEMMLSGEPVDGTRAERIGLVNRVVPADADVVAAALEMAASFTRHSLVPQRAILRAVREGMALPLEEAMALERRLVGEVSASSDTREGVSAFIEKRRAQWSDS